MGYWEAFMKADWRSPYHFATKGAYLWRVFDEEHRYRDGPQRIRGDASELLGSYALMRHFIELNFEGRDELTLGRRSFDVCCSIVDIMIAEKRAVLDVTSMSACRRLQDAISTHMGCHLAAYGLSFVKPNHHLNH